MPTETQTRQIVMIHEFINILNWIKILSFCGWLACTSVSNIYWNKIYWFFESHNSMGAEKKRRDMQECRNSFELFFFSRWCRGFHLTSVDTLNTNEAKSIAQRPEKLSFVCRFAHKWDWFMTFYQMQIHRFYLLHMTHFFDSSLLSLFKTFLEYTMHNHLES